MYIQSLEPEYYFVLNFWNLVGTSHEVIIVDDGSPKKVTQGLQDLYPFINFERIKQDIPWNQPAARNLGAAVASGDILVFTDFDHVFNVTSTSEFDVIADNFSKGANGKTYMFPRIKNGESLGSHPCSFAILRDDFTGFDESFCGNYGYDDTEFTRRHKPIGILPLSTVVVLDKTTHNLERDTTENRSKL